MVDVFCVAAYCYAFVEGDPGVDGVGGSEGVDEGFEVGEGFTVAGLEGWGVALRRVRWVFFERRNGDMGYGEGRQTYASISNTAIGPRIEFPSNPVRPLSTLIFDTIYSPFQKLCKKHRTSGA